MPGGGISKYAFLNAKVRGKMSKLLDEEKMRELNHSSDLDHAVTILKDTHYAGMFDQIQNPSDLSEIERNLILAEYEAYDEIYSLSTGSVIEVFGVLKSWYEMEEVKSALRAWYRKQQGMQSTFTHSGISDIPLDEAVGAKTLEDIALILKDSPYGSVVSAVGETIKKRQSIFPLEIALDQDYYRRLWNAIGKLSDQDKRVATRIIGIEVDLKNLQWVIRGLMYYKMSASDLVDDMLPHGWRIQPTITREALAKIDPGEVLGHLSVGPYSELLAAWSSRAPREGAALIESVLWDILVREVRLSLAGFPFTIGTPLAYCLLKRIEIQNIIRVLESIVLGIPPEEREGFVVSVR